MAYGWITSRDSRAADAGAEDISLSSIAVGAIFPAIGTPGTFTVTELGVYVKGPGSGGGTFQMAIYTTGGTLVGSTGEGSELDPPTSEGWVEFTGLSIDIDGETQYVVCVWPDDAYLDFSNALSSGGDGMKRDTTPGTPWTWVAMSWTNLTGYEGNLYGIYEEPAGGSIAAIAMNSYRQRRT